MTDKFDPYSILEVSRSASDEEIKKVNDYNSAVNVFILLFPLGLGHSFLKCLVPQY